MLQILDSYTGLFEHEIPKKKLHMIFRNVGGGGSKAV